MSTYLWPVLFEFVILTWSFDLHVSGTASVIIALTDGELQEHQLVAAQQEVTDLTMHTHTEWKETAPLLSSFVIFVIYVLNRQHELGRWVQLYIVSVWKTSMRHR